MWGWPRSRCRRTKSRRRPHLFFFQAEDGIRDHCVTGVQTCALPIWDFTSASRPATSFWRSSAAFVMLFSLGTNLTGHEGRTQRQLCSGQAERFTSQLFRDAHDFVEHLAGLDFGHVVLGVALTVTHTHFCGLGRDWLVREHADPDTTATLDVTRDRAASRFDLTRRQATTVSGLQAEVTESN